jgi:hypothetical protein
MVQFRQVTEANEMRGTCLGWESRAVATNSCREVRRMLHDRERPDSAFC